MPRTAAPAALAAVAVAALLSAPAHALPTFARKYGTSCTTCHTVYPKLTPFGEAFRRNGYRFPGVDSDYVKQEVIPLRPKGSGEDYGLGAIPPLAIGFNGQAVLHPDKSSSGGAADGHAVFVAKALVEEAHLWTGGSLSDTITYFGELTFGLDGSVDLEHAQVIASDLVGPKHAVNVRVGRGSSTLTSFGPHSSFLSDQLMPSSGLTALNGAGTTWNALDHFNGVEVNGVLGGRFDYSVGLNAGTSFDTRPSENFYGHIGAKLGGLSLDGEGASGVKDAMRPWEERAITLDAWAYRAVNSANFTVTNPDDTILLDTATVLGGSLRAQYDSLELTGGAYLESHNRVTPDPSGATLGFGGSLMQAYGELSYIVRPWLVPALRIESTTVSSDVPGTESVHNLRVTPGIAAAVRPNIKVVLTAAFESSSGTPPGGSWGPVGGTALPGPDATSSSVGLELENVQLFVAMAF